MWDDGNFQPVGDVGSHVFNVGYWPNGNTEYTIFQDIPVTVTVQKANNFWTVTPSIEGWAYGSEPKTPTGSAEYGEVTFTYSNNPDDGFTAKAPTEAGTWYMKAEVEEADNYMGLSNVVAFTIEPDSTNPTSHTTNPPSILSADMANAAEALDETQISNPDETQAANSETTETPAGDTIDSSSTPKTGDYLGILIPLSAVIVLTGIVVLLYVKKKHQTHN